jgi:hypothetical protein
LTLFSKRRKFEEFYKKQQELEQQRRDRIRQTELEIKNTEEQELKFKPNLNKRHDSFKEDLNFKSFGGSIHDKLYQDSKRPKALQQENKY